MPSRRASVLLTACTRHGPWLLLCQACCTPNLHHPACTPGSRRGAALLTPPRLCPTTLSKAMPCNAWLALRFSRPSRGALGPLRFQLTMRPTANAAGLPGIVTVRTEPASQSPSCSGRASTPCRNRSAPPRICSRVGGWRVGEERRAGGARPMQPGKGLPCYA